MTPTEIMPFTEKYPPKTAIITKPILPIQFITGPIMPLKISVLIPAFVAK